MSIRFRKRIKIAPGLAINLSKRGASASIGKRGASINVGGDRGTTGTIGIPGSGLSATTKISGTRKTKRDNHVSGLTVLIAFVLLFALIAWLT